MDWESLHSLLNNISIPIIYFLICLLIGWLIWNMIMVCELDHIHNLNSKEIQDLL